MFCRVTGCVRFTQLCVSDTRTNATSNVAQFNAR